MKMRLFRLLMVGLCVLNFGFALEYILFWISAAQADLFWRADFTALYTAGSFVERGLGKELYDFDLQSEIQTQILAGRSFENGLLPNDYPPHTALFFAPLARLPLKTAFMTWEAIQLVFLAAILVLLWKITAHWQAFERVFLLSFVLGLPPLFFCFTGGGLSLFLLLVSVFFYLSLRSSQQTRAGMWLAVGSLKPQMIFLTFFTLVSRRWFKAVIAGLAGGAAILAASMLLLKWDIWLEFLKILLQVNATTGAYGIHPEIMYTLKGFLLNISGNGAIRWAGILNVILLFASALWIAFCLSKHVRPGTSTFDLSLAFTISLGLFLSPHLYAPDNIALVLPMLLFYEYLRSQPTQRWKYAIFVAILPGLILADVFLIQDALIVHLPTLYLMVLLAWMGFNLRGEIQKSNAAVEAKRAGSTTAADHAS